MATPKKIKVIAVRPLFEGGKNYAKGAELEVSSARHKALGKNVTLTAKVEDEG